MCQDTLRECVENLEGLDAQRPQDTCAEGTCQVRWRRPGDHALARELQPANNGTRRAHGEALTGSAGRKQARYEFVDIGDDASIPEIGTGSPRRETWEAK